jgi:dTMP kinase
LIGMTRPLRIVALVGIDGSGKTTQAHDLAAWLTEHGVPARYAQNAGGRRWFGRLAHRLDLPDGQALLGRAGMLLVEAVLRWLAIARGLVRARLTGRVAVMDRYAVCQYASLRTHARTPAQWAGRSRGERLARACYRLFPTPDATFLLAVPPAEAYRRIDRRGTDHEQLDFLRTAAEAYDALPESAGFVRIDADAPPGEVADAVRSHVIAITPALR